MKRSTTPFAHTVRLGFRLPGILLTLNDTLISRRRFDNTLQLLSVVLPTLDEATGGQVSRVSFQAKRQFAVSLGGLHRWSDAAATYRNLEQAIQAAGPALATLIKSDPARAVIYLRAGSYEEALRAARDEVAWAQSVYGPEHYNTAESRGVEAAALWSSGNGQKARQILDEVVPLLLDADTGQGLNVWGNPLQVERLRALLDAYIGVSTGPDRAERLDNAFRITQVIGESSVMAAIAATAARGAINDPVHRGPGPPGTGSNPGNRSHCMECCKMRPT